MHNYTAATKPPTSAKNLPTLISSITENQQKFIETLRDVIPSAAVLSAVPAPMSGRSSIMEDLQ
jgi:hypothetical protein